MRARNPDAIEPHTQAARPSLPTVRLASAAVGARFPLPVQGTADWQGRAGRYDLELSLPRLSADQIVVPSLTFASVAWGVEISLVHDGRVWELAPVGLPHRATQDPDPRVATHLDYFSIHAPLEGARLRFSARGPAVLDPYLLAIAIRAEHVAPDAGRAVTRRLVVPPIGQLTAPRAIRRRICSPACVTMVLACLGRPAPLAEVVADCYHAPSGIYGVWPHALRAAARQGVLGTVEAIASLDAIAPVLDAGLPVVASIRFEAGALAGAPLPRTDGHLVVVTGLADGVVHVNDPASPSLGDVPRSYDRAEFAAAWLRARGAAYVFCRP